MSKKHKNSLSALPSVLLKPLAAIVSAATGGMPAPLEPRAMRPHERAQLIAKRATAKATEITQKLNLPQDPAAALALVPDLLMVWKIQAQMVVDIAQAYGYKEKLSKEEVTLVMFRHVAQEAMKNYQKAVPIEHDEPRPSLLERVAELRKKSSQMGIDVLSQMADAVMKEVTYLAVTRLVPMASAAMVSAVASLDTKEVAKTAIDFFSGTKESPKRKFLN